jgi:hypothetical protein
LIARQTSAFETVARLHLKSLEDAGESPDQIVTQLTAVAASYAADGLRDEAAALREVVRHYRSNSIKTGDGVR